MKSFLTKNFLIILIVVLAALLRFWQLGQNPPSLFADEVSNGYNAYSILKSGKDEYGNLLPLTFRAFGDYNLALSVYTLVPSIAIFGLNDFAVRFPSALLGTLTVLLTYLLTNKIFPSNQFTFSPAKGSPALLKFLFRRKTSQFSPGHLAAFFLAISPWHLQFSRYDHEANFMVFFTVLAALIFLRSPKNYRHLIVSIALLGLALNTYHAAKIWIPLFLLNLMFWFRHQISWSFGKLFLPLFLLLIAALPIILNLKNSLIRGQVVGILDNQNPLQTFISGYLSHYAPNFLFVSGDTIGRHSVPGMGQLYAFEAPLIIIGLIALARQKTAAARLLLTWFLLSPIPASIATPTPHALRSITFLPTTSIIVSLGLITIINSDFKKRAKSLFLLALGLVAAYNFLTYLHLYYQHYPKEKARDWSSGYKEMVEFIDRVKSDYTTIAISDYFGHPYIYVLFYSKYDPAQYHSQSQNKNAFDKYEFFGPSWQKTKEGKALVVTPPWQSHPPNVIGEIYARNGDLTFTISETQ